MAVYVKIDGKRVEVPADVRAQGAAAVADWEKNQRPAKVAGGGRGK